MKYIGSLKILTESNQDLIKPIREQEDSIYPKFQLSDPETLFTVRELALTSSGECEIVINDSPVTLSKGTKLFRLAIKELVVKTSGVSLQIQYAYGDEKDFLNANLHECENDGEDGGSIPEIEEKITELEERLNSIKLEFEEYGSIQFID